MFNSQESWLLKDIQFEGEPSPGGQGKCCPTDPNPKNCTKRMLSISQREEL